MPLMDTKLTHSVGTGWVSLAQAKAEDGLYECDYDDCGSPPPGSIIYVANGKVFLLDYDGIEPGAEIKEHYKDFRVRRLPKGTEFVITLTQE